MRDAEFDRAPWGEHLGVVKLSPRVSKATVIFSRSLRHGHPGLGLGSRGSPLLGLAYDI
jgi:hypothetical protein